MSRLGCHPALPKMMRSGLVVAVCPRLLCLETTACTSETSASKSETSASTSATSASSSETLASTSDDRLLLLVLVLVLVLLLVLVLVLLLLLLLLVLLLLLLFLLVERGSAEGASGSKPPRSAAHPSARLAIGDAVKLLPAPSGANKKSFRAARQCSI